jgi:ABC-type polar amino acid transport system ATPase subunit
VSIRVIDLEKRHPGSGSPALRGLSLHVPAGQVASIVGKSGAGKTTLLRCLVGLDPFDGGSIEIDGTTVAAGPQPRALSMLGRVGLVFQSFELFPHLSVLENCTLAPVVAHRKPRAAAEKRALELLEQLGLADKAGAFPEALSGGQRQRVAIARALATEPRVLLYDEPTSALDPSLKQEVGRSLRRVAATGITQILVTHDFDVAREASDVVFVLEAGRVARSGPPAEVLAAGDAA